MPLFGFDDQFPLFDITPVENLFIQEYPPEATGEQVKVYLYGLMQCYHPRAEDGLGQMCKDLAMAESDVLKAFRYWERKGLVARVGDHPPAFEYLNAKQRMFMRSAPPRDAAYEDFGIALNALFGQDRKIHGKESQLAYEWVEQLGLPQEVVLMMLQHCIQTRGRQFEFRSAEKLAVQLAEENVHTIEDAEKVLSRSRMVEEEARKLLRRMGKKVRFPSDDEMDLYTKWTRDWGYGPQAIEAACAETTGGDPSFKYLDAILKGMRQRHGKAADTGKELEGQRQAEQRQVEPLKALLAVLGKGAVNPETLRMYGEMLALYPEPVILLAGRECAAKSRGLEDVCKLVQAWAKRGLTHYDEIARYVETRKAQDAFLATLYELWGKRGRPTVGDRSLLARWREEWGFTGEMITFCAGYCAAAERPMAYLDKLLEGFHQTGVATPEAAAAARGAYQAAAPKPAGKTVGAQQYAQRAYAQEPMAGWTPEMLEEAKNSHA